MRKMTDRDVLERVEHKSFDVEAYRELFRRSGVYISRYELENNYIFGEQEKEAIRRLKERMNGES